MTTEASGEIELNDGVLVIKRIHVTYHLRLDADADRASVERAFTHHTPRCPVYRSIRAAIEITTSLETLDAGDDEGPVAGALLLIGGQAGYYTRPAFRHLRYIFFASTSKSRTALAGSALPRATWANICGIR